MHIDIQAQSFSLTEALHAYVERRLSFIISAGDSAIQSIAVRLCDINGPRGGADKCCRIHIVLAQTLDIVIEDTELNLYAAIDRASGRAGRTLCRRLARQRDRSRTTGLSSLQA